MAIEIERKFLVLDDSWRAQADAGLFLSQGYLSTDPKRCVRVRIAGEQAWLNIKSAVSSVRRLEYDYPIPLADARELLENACIDAAVEKVRYHVPCGEQV
jgi:adenylate cyclase